jgi:acyl-CoA synthetase (AMP-forming)/AMP-acid ligase II
VLARHPGLELYLTYGLTEAGPRVSTLAAHLAAPRHHASVGLPLPGVGVRLRPRAPGDRVGELVVETDTGMLRRVGRADETPIPPGADGRRLIGTGDLFEVDDEGYLFFRGRRPGFVMSHGEKISPQSVCEIAELIPGVRGAQAWLRETDTGEFEFTLDVYCATDLLDERDVRRRLAKVLLRSEQPAHVLIHPATHLGWRKSAAD